VGYRFLIINSSVLDMAIDTIMESKDAIFFEDEFSMKNNTPSMSSHNSISISESHEPVIHADDETFEEIHEEDNYKSLERVRDGGL
jgi:aspartyl/asparaginyl beta-hydroxylase (cupin superfamily)